MVSGTAPYFQKLHPCVGCIPERQEQSGAVGFNDYADLFARYPDRVARSCPEMAPTARNGNTDAARAKGNVRRSTTSMYSVLVSLAEPG